MIFSGSRPREPKYNELVSHFMVGGLTGHLKAR